MPQYPIVSYAPGQKLADPLMSAIEDTHLRLSFFEDEAGLESALSEQTFFLVLIQINDTDSQTLQWFQRLVNIAVAGGLLVLVATPHRRGDTIVQLLSLGAHDVFTFDQNHDELSHRILGTLKLAEFKNKQLKKLTVAEQAAFDAAADIKNLREIVRFLERSACCEHYTQLADLLIELFGNLELEASFCFFFKDESLFFSTYTKKSYKEHLLLVHFKEFALHPENTEARCKPVAGNIVVASEHCAILLKAISIGAVPESRICDLLNTLINGVDMRVAYIYKLECERSVFNYAQGVIHQLKTCVSDLEADLRSHEKETMSIMDNLLARSQEGLTVLGLTEEQEKFFTCLLEDSMARLSRLYAYKATVDEKTGQMMQITQSFHVNWPKSDELIHGLDTRG